MNDESHSTEATHPTSFTPHADAGASQRGRPSGYSPVKLNAICAFIRLTGMPATTAAAMAGIPRATLSRWKDRYEEVEIELERARAQYIVPRLQKIAETRVKDGQLDWRAQAWLIKYASPELHGPPSRRRRLQDLELSPEEEQAAARPAVAEENVTNRSEIPAPAQEAQAEVNHDNVAIRPETAVAATPPPAPQEWRPGAPRPTRRELRRQRRMERKAPRAQA